MPASTNFIQFNPTQSNQETDAQYVADALRIAGAQLDNIFLSPLANKLFYQFSTFITAFCNALVIKGFSPMDTNLTALTTILGNVLTTADTQASYLNVPYNASPVFNRAAAQGFNMVLTGNVTNMTLNGLSPGQIIVFTFFDPAGGHTVAWASNIEGAGVIDGSAPPSTNFVQMFYVGGDNVARAITGQVQYTP